MKRNLARAGANQRRDLVAHADSHLPPALFPRADAALRPGIRVRAHLIVDPAGHRAERIADHVRGALKNRKLAAPLEKFIHLAPLHGLARRVESFSKQSSTP